MWQWRMVEISVAPLPFAGPAQPDAFVSFVANAWEHRI